MKKKQFSTDRILRSLAAAAFAVAPASSLVADTIDIPEGSSTEYVLTAKTGVIDDLTFTGNGTLVLTLLKSDTSVAANFDAFSGTIQIQNGDNAEKWVKLNSKNGSFAQNKNITLDILDGAQLYLNANMSNDVYLIGTGKGNGENRGAIRLQGNLSGNVYLKGDATIGLQSGGVSGAISGSAATNEVQTLTLGTSVANGTGTFSGVISDGQNGGKLAVVAAYGTSTLTAANAFSGGLTVQNNAVVKLGNAARTAGTYRINDNARLEMNINSSGGIFENMVFVGDGALRLTPTAENSYVTSGNFDNFSGTVQVAANNGLNKFTFEQNNALVQNSAITIEILPGGQIYLKNQVVVNNPIRVAGTGNEENRGAIRLTTSSVVNGSVTLTDDATIGLGNGTITGAIAGTAAENEVQTLTLGTKNEALSGTFSGVVSDGQNGGKLNLHVAYGNSNLTATNTASGSLLVSGGTATFSSKNAFSSVVVTGGVLNLNKEKGTIPTSSSITVGSESGDAAVLKLNASKALGDHTAEVTLYQGSKIEINGDDVSIGNKHGIAFVGGGDVSGSGYFWLRGNGAKFTLTGENAVTNISCPLYLYRETVAIDVQNASSKMTISSAINSWDDKSGIFGGLNKQGAGELILTNTAINLQSFLNVQEGKLTFTNASQLSNADLSVSQGAVFHTDRGATVQNYALNGTQEMTIIQNGDRLEILPVNVSNAAEFGKFASFTLTMNEALDLANLGSQYLVTANSIVGPEKIQVNLSEALFPSEPFEIFAYQTILGDGYAYQLNLDWGNRVPEPASWALLALGAFGLVALRSRKR